MTDLQRALCRDIFNHYGSNMQMDVMQEECAELIQAISKVKRKGLRASTFDNLIEELIEELADVEIMIEQMKYMLKDDLEAVIKVKLERQRDRIEKEIEERRIEDKRKEKEIDEIKVTFCGKECDKCLN